jgi:hypothetical protein
MKYRETDGSTAHDAWGTCSDCEIGKRRQIRIYKLGYKMMMMMIIIIIIIIIISMHNTGKRTIHRKTR